MSLENAAGDPPGRGIRENDRGREKEHCTAPRNFSQKITRAARSENGRTRTAENCPHICALALLQQDNDHHRDADNNMKSDNCCNHRLF